MSGVRSGDETFLTLTREVLYELAWSYPVTPLAAELGVTPLMLTRFCRKLDVPYPAAAYWTRQRNGGHGVRANLRPPDLATVTAASIRCRPAPRLLMRLEALSCAQVSNDLDTLTNRFRERLGHVPCVAHSTRLHRGLQPARQRLGKRPPSGGVARARRISGQGAGSHCSTVSCSVWPVQDVPPGSAVPVPTKPWCMSAVPRSLSTSRNS